jgi:DNA-binding FrmR family transcriptional regulator
MSTPVSNEYRTSSSTQAEVLDLLRKVHSQIENIAGMVQSDVYGPEVLWGLYEVQRALCCVVSRLAANEIDQCFSAAVQSSDPFRQQQALSDVVNLYTFVCRQQPQLISGREVLWQHK